MSRRTYDNSLRAEQAGQTRERILSAACALLADPSGPLTFPEIAARSGVSEPTVYRYFASRAELFSAVAARMSKALGQPPTPDRVEDLPALVAAVILYFGRHAEWFRAAILNPHLRELRRSGRRGREESIGALLAPSLAHLAPRERELANAAFFTIVRAESWDHATRSLGLSDEETARALAWVMSAMLDSLRVLQAQGATRLVDDALLDDARRLSPDLHRAPASSVATPSPPHAPAAQKTARRSRKTEKK